MTSNEKRKMAYEVIQDHVKNEVKDCGNFPTLIQASGKKLNKEFNFSLPDGHTFIMDLLKDTLTDITIDKVYRLEVK